MPDRHERDARLRARLRAADGIAAPDLWRDIERRIPTSLDVRRMRRSPARRILVAVASLAVAGAGVFVVARAFSGPRPVVATDVPGSTGVAFLTEAADGRTFDLVLVTGAHPGLHRIVLASGLGLDASPAWSRDGRRIAYLVPLSGGHSAVEVENADGTGRLRLTNCCRDADPTWSPDGTTVAFVRSAAGSASTSIDAVASTGGPARVLCPETVCGDGVAELAYSPDGSTIAFSHAGLIGGGSGRQTALVAGIDLIAADGSNFRPLTSCGKAHCTIDVAPSWSPDGQMVAYNRGAGMGHGQRFRIVAVATGATRAPASCVVPHCPSHTFPVWSPGGDSIAYATSHAPSTGQPAIIVASLRTGRLTTLPTCQGSRCVVPFAVVWSPDGSTLAFIRVDRPGGSFVGQAVYLLSADGGTPRRLAVGDGICCLAWQPSPGG